MFDLRNSKESEFHASFGVRDFHFKTTGTKFENAESENCDRHRSNQLKWKKKIINGMSSLSGDVDERV